MVFRLYKLSRFAGTRLGSTIQSLIQSTAGVALVAILAFGAIAQTPTSSSTAKTDSEIRQCIENRLASSEKLGGQGFTVAVMNREATLSGTARNSGSKGAVTRIARTCGAEKVSNLITAPSPRRSPQKD